MKQKTSELKRHFSIADEIGKRVHLRKKNGLLIGQCPWHEDKTPSLTVYEETQTFYCYSCGAKRDVIDFIARFYEVDFQHAVEILRGSVTMNAPKRILTVPEKVTVNAQEVFDKLPIPSLSEICGHAEYLGVSPGSLRWLDVRIQSGNLVFPMRDAECNIIGLRFRARDSRKWALRGAGSGLFIPNLKPKSKRLYIAEGPTDCAALLTIGLFAVGRPSCLGQESFVSDFATKNGFTHAVIIADNDTARKRPDGSDFFPGQEGAAKLQKSLAIPSLIWKPPVCKDVREFLRTGGDKNEIGEEL